MRYAIIGEDAKVCANARIGVDPELYEKSKWDFAVVGKDKEVAQNTILLPKQVY